MNYWTSQSLHEELALIYQRSPGVTVVNSLTESLWRRIEQVEYEEELARAVRRAAR